MMGIFFDGPAVEVTGSEALSDWVNSVGNDSVAGFFAASIAELVGNGIKNLQLNPDQTIGAAAFQLDSLNWASKASFLQGTVTHLTSLYENTQNQQVRGHLTRQLRLLNAELNEALARTSATAVEAVGKSAGAIYLSHPG